MCNGGLMSFEELKSFYNLPGPTFWFYLQLRTAMKIYGVPWADNLFTHPVEEMVTSNIPKGFVSYIYRKLQSARNANMGITTVWNIVIKEYGICNIGQMFLESGCRGIKSVTRSVYTMSATHTIVE